MDSANTQKSRFADILTYRYLWLALPILALPITLPLLTIGLTASADGASHLMRTALLVTHWQEGVLYPRWMPELVTGLGYPVLNFYAPATYYLIGVLDTLGLPLANAMSVTLILLAVAGGAGMYLLAGDLFGRRNPWAALLAGAAYMYAPYLLANVFVRGAVAEVGAQALLPWILWCARRMVTSGKPAAFVVAFALSLGALAVTHTVTLILFPPFLLGYLLVLWWQQGHSGTRLGWIAAGIASAMGISAFFWAPLLGESGFLSQEAFGTSVDIFVPENMWHWQTLLDLNFPFEYTFDVPYQLGFVQLGLAVVGLFFVRRWNPEWLYLLVATLVACLAIGAWAEPIWLNNRVLLAVQFPWRLLAVISVTLPIFTGALVWRIRQPRYQALAALALVALVVLANRPEVGWMGALETEGGGMPLPAIARHESITGQLGTGPTREFMPRWVQSSTYAPAPADTAISGADIRLTRSGASGLELEIDSAAGGPLRFTSFYFPGWRATLDGTRDLETYPSTNLGLLTVDLPPGSHHLRVANPGTDLQRWATWLTLAALLALTGLAWRARSYGLAGVCALLFVGGATALLLTPQPSLVQPPAAPVATADFSLLGYRVEQADGARLLIYPTWYVRQTPQSELRFAWMLRDAAGRQVNLTATRPYFNSQGASNWPPGVIADDGYELALPDGLPAGAYDLLLSVYPPAGEPVAPPAVVGSIAIEGTAPARDPGSAATALALRFGDEIRLVGYAVRTARGATDDARTPVVAPGDSLAVTLDWAAAAPPSDDYHSFVHLLDQNGDAVAQADHLPGSIFHPPMTWDTAHVQRDDYTLHIPADTPNGLLWPTAGIYRYDDQQRLPIEDDSGNVIGNTYRLPPIKVFSPTPVTAPQHAVDAQFGDWATLVGYDLLLPAAGLRAGSQFTLTLAYAAKRPADGDLTQFVHLFDPALGMAAQQDAPPQGGANPTSTWQPGEIVRDEFVLRIDEQAGAGIYTLGVGMYNPVDGMRAPVTDAAGTPLPEGAVPLVDLRVAP